MTEAADAFWRYSLRLYERSGASDALLTLQDVHGADVNIILYALFAGAVHGTWLRAADLAQLNDAAESWSRLAVRPLRALRRDLKPLAADSIVAAFRADVKRLEPGGRAVLSSRASLRRSRWSRRRRRTERRHPLISTGILATSMRRCSLPCWQQRTRSARRNPPAAHPIGGPSPC